MADIFLNYARKDPKRARQLAEVLEAARPEAKTRLTERGGVELVLAPAGSFLMGSPDTEKHRRDREGPQHEVSVPSFWISRYAVTNEQYSRFLESHPNAEQPVYWRDQEYNRTRQPVVGINWDEARSFAKWVGGRLPSEAQWEYAARAGTTDRYLLGSTKDHLNRYGWYSQNSEERLHPVGQKEPNPWGLYDVLGNVWEWLEDDFHGSYKGAPDDGSAWIDDTRGLARVVRGGAFRSHAQGLRAACRSNDVPGYRNSVVGFRVVLSAGGQ